MASDERDKVGKLGCEWCASGSRSGRYVEGRGRRKDRECAAA
jgi:hypothetical protein